MPCCIFAAGLLHGENMGEKINARNASEYGKLGAKKSAEVRRRKRDMRETLEVLLSMKLDDGKRQRLEDFKGFHDITRDDNITVAEKMMVIQVKKALAGDLDAVKFIREQIGEKPKDEVEITTIQVPKFEGEDELED